MDRDRFFEQLKKCEHQKYANHTEWGILAHVAWRHPATLQEEPLHNDHLMSVALVAVLADADLQPHTATSTPAPRRSPGRQEEDV